MISSSTRHGAAIILAALTAGLSASSFAEVPPRSAGGQTLTVPDEQLDQGEIYHVSPGEGTQFVWTSDAPLLRLMAVCNRVVGYFVVPFDLEDDEQPLLAGALRIPVASLSTGSASFDRQLHGSGLLDAAKYPAITLHLTRFSDWQMTANDDGRRSYTVKAAGEFVLKDKTVALEIPLQLVLAPFNWQIMRHSMSNALIVRAKFDLKTSDLGLAPADSPGDDFSSDVARFDIFLLCSTASPELHLDPRIERQHHLKRLQFLTLLRDFNDSDRAYEYGRAFMKEIWDCAPVLNELAQTALTEDGIKTRDLAFILKAAQRANELSEFKDAAHLHTLARTRHEMGDLPAALKWIRQAAEHLDGVAPYVAAQIRATQQSYEAQAGTQ